MLDKRGKFKLCLLIFLYSIKNKLISREEIFNYFKHFFFYLMINPDVLPRDFFTMNRNLI